MNTTNLNFVFSNLYGCSYKEGNIIFTPNGNAVLSPVGNRVTQFDLKNNTSTTFPFQNRKSISRLAISPDGTLLLSVDLEGRLLLVNLFKKVVLQRMKLKFRIKDISFSPNGEYISITNNQILDVWYSPAKLRKFASFQRFKSFKGHHDEITCLAWSSDSTFLATGSDDMTVRVFALHKTHGFKQAVLGGHRNTLKACFFKDNSLNLYTICKGGLLIYWVCEHTQEQAANFRNQSGMQSTKTGSDNIASSLSNATDTGETNVSTSQNFLQDKDSDENSDNEDEDNVHQANAKRLKRTRSIVWILDTKHTLNKEHHSDVASARYNSRQNIIVVGFKNGLFLLIEASSFSTIYSMSISNHPINAISISPSGDWLALASKKLGEFVVWEWSSQSFVLKQQGHYQGMSSLAYSPDAQIIATGGEDGKVKLWNTLTNFCYVTFTEHTAPVTSICFNQTGQVILSASLDGTVKAFDTQRYRNFRTYTSPNPTQFSCLAIDSSGELICAASDDNFEIFMWSLQTGKLLEILHGHTGPITSIQFSPIGSVLASGSWDNSCRISDVLNPQGNNDSFSFSTNVLALSFRPDGKQIAISTLNAQISIWELETGIQIGTLECRSDLWSGRRSSDMVTAKHLETTKCFTSLAYTVDGKCLLAGGKSKYICIYHVANKILLKRFQLSTNKSFDGMQRYLDSRNMTEGGPEDLIDDNSDSENEADYLPGVEKGKYKKVGKEEFITRCVVFSPTGQSWAAVTSEGLVVYQLDKGLEFDPYDLGVEITPRAILKAIQEGDFIEALAFSLHLNEKSLVQRTVESIKLEDINLVATTLPYHYVPRLLSCLQSFLQSTSHLQFYIVWIQTLLTHNGKGISENRNKVGPLLIQLQKIIQDKMRDLSALAESNKYMLDYLQKSHSKHHSELNNLK